MPHKFIIWYYSDGTKGFLRIWKNYLEFFWRYFSVSLLLVTLFSPWKRDVTQVGRRGFHPVLWLNSLLMNVVTRFVGSIVRAIVIFCAVFLEILAVVFGLAIFLIWIFLPIFLVVSLLAAVKFSYARITPTEVTWLIFILFNLIIFFLAIFSYRNSKVDFYATDPDVLFSQKWFSRVWERLGVTKEEAKKEILKDKNLFQDFLTKNDLTEAEFNLVLEWERSGQIEREEKRHFWTKKNLFAKRPIGKNWAFAYTVNLDRYALDFSQYDLFHDNRAQIAEKEQDLSELKLILSRPSQNSILLIGETGVGKDTVVRSLAQEIRDMKAGEEFNHRRILSLDIREIISSGNNKENVDGVLGTLFSEAAYAGNIILFIKDIHEYLKINPLNREEDISSVLVSFLPHPNFQIIATTTPEEFHANIEKKKEVMKFFEKIQVAEMNEKDTMTVLLNKLKNIEKQNVVFTYQGLRTLIKLCDRYVTETPFPEKALDMLEEVILFWNNNGSSRFITPEVVSQAFSNKIKVPLGEMTKDESEKLMNLEKVLHQRVIGQNFAISQIAETMRRARIGMSSTQKPLGSFLFLGPTGVGKTETTKTLAESYFGDESRMIRLDMSEYQTASSIDRLIGSTATGKEGHLVSQVKDSPYSVLLLDEIEKAYPDILNLFLQVLDEGALTDAFGKKISFKNLIIIATSNVASEIIHEAIEKKMSNEEIQKAVIDYAVKNGIFRPEFLNRFEGVIFFHPLSQENIFEIAKMLLGNYAAKLKNQENILVKFAPQVVEVVAEKSFDPLFGARAVNRFIEDKIGDKIVKKIISGEVKKGSEFSFGVEDLE